LTCCSSSHACKPNPQRIFTQSKIDAQILLVATVNHIADIFWCRTCPMFGEELSAGDTTLNPEAAAQIWPDGHRRRRPALIFALGVFVVATSAAAVAVLTIAPWAVPRDGEAVIAAPEDPAGAVELTIAPPPTAAADERLPLGISVTGNTQGGVLVIGGLPSGASLSVGQPLPPNGWWLTADELASAMVAPPRGFSGAMELVVEFRRADDRVIERQQVRLQWDAARLTATPVVAMSASPTPAAGAPSQPGARRLERSEIVALLARGDDLMASGDMGGARLVLGLAAEARDPRAALALGATYDPLILEKLGVRGRVADVAQARFWYEKAVEFGSKEGARRLQSLAQWR
jgi:hypothetical protein